MISRSNCIIKFSTHCQCACGIIYYVQHLSIVFLSVFIPRGSNSIQQIIIHRNISRFETELYHYKVHYHYIYLNHLN